jgi:hypothetical protein
MSGRGKDDTPIFPAAANATPVDQIAPPPVDPRNARVHKLHQEIARQVKTGEIYKQPRKSR